MGSTNHGNQHVNYSFFDELRQEEWARKDNNITPRGIYSGGYLTYSGTELRLSQLKVEIGDSNIQVSIGTSEIIIINDTTLDSGSLLNANQYIVLRYGYLYDPNNFFGVHAVSTPQVNDIVVGKVSGVGGSIDYTERSEPNTIDYRLKVIQIANGGMYVRVQGGSIQTTSKYIKVKNQVVGPFVAPIAPNSRKDLVYIDNYGVAKILQGSASLPPQVAPVYNGKLVVAEVLVSNGVTSIPTSAIQDVRAPYTASTTDPTATILAAVSFGQKTTLDSSGLPLVRDVVYRASGDGYLTVHGHAYGQILIEAGSTNNPVDIVNNSAVSSHVSGAINVFYPVSAGEYVRIRVTHTMVGAYKCYFKPVGTSALVKQ